MSDFFLNRQLPEPFFLTAKGPSKGNNKKNHKSNKIFDSKHFGGIFKKF